MSGEKVVYPTGAQRSRLEDLRYDLIPPHGLRRLAMATAALSEST